MTPPAESAVGGGASPTYGATDQLLRIFALCMVSVGLSFVLNNYLIFWLGWPGLEVMFADLGWLGFGPLKKPLEGGAVLLGWLQVATYVGPVAAIIVWVQRTPDRSPHTDSDTLSNFAAFIARAAFWAVLLVGLEDAIISFLRVEDLLGSVAGEDLAKDLGRSSFRGLYVHYPLIALSIVIAFFTRTLGFIWLALLVVVAEMQIVIFRFIFSYEQAFMADLVRFWYAALFLFSSAYTLLHEGHVRVDLLYAGFSERKKAWSNTVGALLLGVPVCWVILSRGMASKTSSINGPMLNYEVTQAGFGMYVKYFMAGFLAVYALSMLVQFMSYFLNSVAILLREPDAQAPPAKESHF
jgi:TRAP-type mannitol/chloroaromatic compound transport system permease small subunit